MIQHPSDAHLGSFVRGDLGEADAVAVALHLDDCPRCATRAAGFDPLASAFASCDDPLVPDDLVAAVLAAAADIPIGVAPSGVAPSGVAPEPERARIPLGELLAAAGLLSAAAMLFLMLGEPTALAADAALAASAGITAANLVATELSTSTWVVMPMAALAFLLCLAVASGFGRRPLPFARGSSAQGPDDP
ncbi:MAG TPA: zf-HC2 domain-containing protein [Myxococcota bacterium]|nr:zf-HC2 domain-containing protein [Myxococcota bacterium]